MSAKKIVGGRSAKNKTADDATSKSSRGSVAASRRQSKHPTRDVRGDVKASVDLPFKTEKLDKVLKSTPDSKIESGGGDAPRDAVTYEVRYVAFMDILGFSEAISKSKANDSDLPAKIYNALDIRLDTLECGAHQLFDGALNGSDLRVHSFSDCVVISSSNSPVGLASMLFACWRVASDWLEQGFLCRGGITRGAVTHRVDGEAKQGKSKSTLVFGPAFVEAYHLESKIADFSRIVLSKEVRKDLITNGDVKGFEKFRPLVKKCDDGPHCLDIFAHIRKKGRFTLGASLGDHKISVSQYAKHLAAHYDDSSDMPHFYRKVKWLVDQFNHAIVDTQFADKKIEHA